MCKTMRFAFTLIFPSLLALVGIDASAVSCTPVVYAFRHAEDFNPLVPPVGGPYGFLTNTGATHASLYPAMIAEFQAIRNYCPVTKVYASNPSKDGGSINLNINGAVNAFCTGRPLALSLIPKQTGALPSDSNSWPKNSLCMNPLTGTPVGALSANDPIIFIRDSSDSRVGLDEYLVNKNRESISDLLRMALLANANEGKSSAIFWTSQGLHKLGGAIINGNSNIPVKNGNATPPRNAIYLFESIGIVGNISSFKDTPAVSRLKNYGDTSSKWVQCFNHVNPGYRDANKPIFNPVISLKQRYYCGYGSIGSNIGGLPIKTCKMNEVNTNCQTNIPTYNSGTTSCSPLSTSGPGCNANILAKICDVSNIQTGTSTTTNIPHTSGSSYYGACE